MKTVGNQLQEARLAKNWTPELAARETKIRVDRVRDLETDDYSHFSSPAYARGFVRTYARALGLDEYKILRQLDNKLPEDDNASFSTDSGLPYIPEASKPVRGGPTGSSAGLYVVMVLGCGVILIISFVLFQAYRAGELQRYFAHAPASETNSAATNAVPNNTGPEPVAHALPLDSHAAPPDVDTTHVLKALPVEEGTPAANVAPTSEPSPQPLKALPVNSPDQTNATPVADTTDMTNGPRALPVDPNELTGATNAPPPPPPPVPAFTPTAPPSARASGSAHPATTPPPPTPASSPAASPTASTSGKRLILTATRDSFVRVTSIDAPDLERSLYAAVLKAGQSAAFDGHKFSVNVGVPSAINVSLDGVNYGPHSDQDKPETFTVESHLP